MQLSVECDVLSRCRRQLLKIYDRKHRYTVEGGGVGVDGDQLTDCSWETGVRLHYTRHFTRYRGPLNRQLKNRNQSTETDEKRIFLNIEAEQYVQRTVVFTFT